MKNPLETVLDFDSLIAPLSIKYGVDHNVIRATIVTESAAEPWSCRYEPGYRYLVNPRDWADKFLISMETETMLQMTSIGLMHVMGGVAREHGFDGLLSQLFLPGVSLEYGVRHLQKKAQSYGTDPATLYAAYNAGSPRKEPSGMFVNQKNVDRFMTNLRALGG